MRGGGGMSYADKENESNKQSKASGYLHREINRMSTLSE